MMVCTICKDKESQIPSIPWWQQFPMGSWPITSEVIIPEGGCCNDCMDRLNQAYAVWSEAPYGLSLKEYLTKLGFINP